VGPRNHVLDGVQIHGKKGRPIVTYRGSLPWAVQKRLNRSRCCFVCGLRWVQGSMC